MFSGSYKPEDVIFLLNIDTKLKAVSKEVKENLIKSGVHYSSLIVKEEFPSTFQESVYFRCLKEKVFLSQGVLALAHKIVEDSKDSPITLLSLVRAGTPLGVLIYRAIKRIAPEKTVFHYGISIIRDYGLDVHAMKYIEENHLGSSFYFIDGWTGKGTIKKSLEDSLKDFKFIPECKLVVFSDPARCSWCCFTYADTALPFGMLNSTVSGLISRTIYNPDGYHLVKYYEDFEMFDLTYHFINEIDHLVKTDISFKSFTLEGKSDVNMIEVLCEKYNVESKNIKASICETTRALLRRIPKKVILASRENEEVHFIVSMCNRFNVEIVVDSSIYPYKAITLLA